MPADTVLLSVYALLLLGMAYGLRALGRRSTSPWASRTLAGHLRDTGEPPEPLRADDWPHSEVPRLYAGMGLTAALASTALSAAGLLLHHGAGTVAVLAVLLALSTLTVVRIALDFRTKVIRA